MGNRLVVMPVLVYFSPVSQSVSQPLSGSTDLLRPFQLPGAVHWAGDTMVNKTDMVVVLMECLVPWRD